MVEMKLGEHPFAFRTFHTHFTAIRSKACWKSVSPTATPLSLTETLLIMSLNWLMAWETFLLDTAYWWGDKVWPSVLLVGRLTNNYYGKFQLSLIHQKLLCGEIVCPHIVNCGLFGFENIIQGKINICQVGETLVKCFAPQIKCAHGAVWRIECIGC